MTVVKDTIGFKQGTLKHGDSICYQFPQEYILLEYNMSSVEYNIAVKNGVETIYYPFNYDENIVGFLFNNTGLIHIKCKEGVESNYSFGFVQNNMATHFISNYDINLKYINSVIFTLTSNNSHKLSYLGLVDRPTEFKYNISKSYSSFNVFVSLVLYNTSQIFHVFEYKNEKIDVLNNFYCNLLINGYSAAQLSQLDYLLGIVLNTNSTTFPRKKIHGYINKHDGGFIYEHNFSYYLKKKKMTESLSLAYLLQSL